VHLVANRPRGGPFIKTRRNRILERFGLSKRGYTREDVLSVETKSSLFADDLRDKEGAKMECGKAHFNALAVGENPSEFIQARNIDDLMAKC
jgi:hypothetical protein